MNDEIRGDDTEEKWEDAYVSADFVRETAHELRAELDELEAHVQIIKGNLLPRELEAIEESLDAIVERAHDAGELCVCLLRSAVEGRTKSELLTDVGPIRPERMDAGTQPGAPS